jgi:tRNA1Val (adenine37-N6)-methyltransferase
MASNYFTFKQFTINQEKSAFKVGTDGVLLGAATDISDVRRILDIGSGTGLIAIMLAQRCDAEIYAIEPDVESFGQCCENINSSKWSNRIKPENVRLQDFDPGERLFDLIVSNPPYFSDSMKSPDMRRSAARHNDTLTSAEILQGVDRLLADNGRFQIIMPYVEGNIFIAEANCFGLYCNGILKIRPMPTYEIRRLVLTFSRKNLKAKERFLTIERGERHQYTEDYINLTKEFYLKF